MLTRPGGSLGWKGKGDLLPEFATAAFEVEVSTVNNPKWTEAKTREGYHLIVGFRHQLNKSILMWTNTIIQMVEGRK